MSDQSAEALLLYLRFRDEIDTQCDRLREFHADELNCRRGCSHCCTHLALLPVEWYSLGRQLQESGMERPSESLNPGACPFLVDDACAIYPLRPLICRIFGLPQLWAMEEWSAAGERLPEDEWERFTDWCELNFIRHGDDRRLKGAAAGMAVDMLVVNRRLTELNLLFLNGAEGRIYEVNRRYPMGDLLNKEFTSPALLDLRD